jgi:hypothetical protein
VSRCSGRANDALVCSAHAQRVGVVEKVLVFGTITERVEG